MYIFFHKYIYSYKYIDIYISFYLYVCVCPHTTICVFFLFFQISLDITKLALYNCVLKLLYVSSYYYMFLFSFCLFGGGDDVTMIGKQFSD